MCNSRNSCNMDISIIICTYNRCALLKKTLESIANVEIPQGLEWQVLVVDNNSSDGTKNIINSFAAQSRAAFKYIFEARQGKSFAVNRGIKESNGEIIAFLDDDVEVDKKWLKAVISAATQYPDVTGFGGKELLNWPIAKPSWVIVKGRFKNIDGTIGGHRDCGESDEDFQKLNNLPTGGNMFFRKKAFDEDNYFREDLGPIGQKMEYGEDAEFCRRLVEKGEKLFYISKAIVYHNIPVERINKKYFCRRRFDSACDEIRYRKGDKKLPYLFGVPRYLFMHFLSDFIKWIFSIRNERRFFYRLKVCTDMGQIKGYRKVTKMRNNKTLNDSSSATE